MLAVARTLLPRVGPMALTYSLLADQAQVTRQTLYRHWPSREALLVDLVLSGPGTDYPQSDPDLHVVATAFLRSFRQGMEDPATGAALMTLAAQADKDAESERVLQLIAEDRCRAFNQLLLAPATPIAAGDFARLIGPVLFQRFIARQPVSDEFLESVVANWRPQLQQPAD
ncbi:helix-turn-helix domain-containing protein [Streptomyces sp. NPDC047023]|uniref:TetR/AcrR family transcriptional regulator n=1 Tax=Streptomyces sp. NPDC047023 TaxID=3155139 RepID=UPI0033C9E348